MAHRSLRGSRFGRRTQMGEDINPSAYIVNLADCMLVLACGLMVALITAWQIDLGVRRLDDSTLTETDPQELTADVVEGGSYYVEVGKVYRDPNTGILYMIREDAVDE